MEQRSEEMARPQHVVPAPDGLARGAPVPWWVKLGVKLGLAAVGVHGGRARRLGLARPSFEAGDPAKLLNAPPAWLAEATRLMGRRPRTLLEVGPGRMVLRAPVLAGLGLEHVWFVDPSDAAPADPGAYLAVATLARSHGVPVPDLTGCADRTAILRRCQASLLLGGPEVLAAIPDGAVDLVVSEAVLEHVRRSDLAPLLAQLRRVTAPDGVGIHRIDFQDHLGGGLQHLRFSDSFWASALVGKAGIYVNRLGLSAMVGRFRHAGFTVEVPEAVVWPRRPKGPHRPHPDAMRPLADDLVARAVLEVRMRR
ncbi:class I SAM-dependent methyltransferase [Paeniroseomonas aquatica]|uniref:Class I SAM-dependent methyltransferase n=1 Tax=Paeniroseomonas aquatica TaxID=373043 RepID=A0ABT8A694_9PROT|nr:class I SAM-dependent methyltransferase [Paeniroseomonas aquatica]MDN3565292.1 class I SAM-dependent methyltransferase [Paeniroseomonas aquatica]